ncbi:MAG: hypothetical protein RL095_3363 [Verrucomicrobiota bacterium]|jgi:hypothetical protein
MPERFTEERLRAPALSMSDVAAQLRHFVLLTYAVDPERVRPYVDESFDLDCYLDAAGRRKVWVSAVPFEDQDFHFHGLPWWRFRFGQTNYRTYVIERRSGRRCVWFFGTVLDSWTRLIPRHFWKLPWHSGRIQFDTDFDETSGRYRRYRMNCQGEWAAAELELEDLGEEISSIDGFDDLESSLVILTHPLTGFYRRRDGLLGSYSIWHPRLAMNRCRLVSARFELLHRLGLVNFEEQKQVHSLLIQRECLFHIHLPPRRLASP